MLEDIRAIAINEILYHLERLKGIGHGTKNHFWEFEAVNDMIGGLDEKGFVSTGPYIGNSVAYLYETGILSYDNLISMAIELRNY